MTRATNSIKTIHERGAILPPAFSNSCFDRKAETSSYFAGRVRCIDGTHLFKQEKKTQPRKRVNLPDVNPMPLVADA